MDLLGQIYGILEEKKIDVKKEDKQAYNIEII
jgi:hypothetical protein